MPGFDVVIVGGGTAGSVLAGRLSEDPDRSVLVLEAGPVYTADTLPDSIRFLSRRLDPEHDWADEADSAGRRIPYTRGRVAGGSSAVNATMAFRPVPADVDAWGVTGWGWADLAPHFDAVERVLPLQRWRSDEYTEAQTWFVERCRALGFPDEPDHNDPATTGGIGPIPMNRRGRERVSAADAWLYPALDRSNLTVRGDTLVERVVVQDGRAVGVVAGGAHIAAGEVVVCGGVLQTPLLLRRSGVDHPALGGNLSDHPSVPVPFAATYEAGSPTVQTMLRTNDLDLMVFPTSQGQLYASPQVTGARGRVHGDGRIEWPFLDDPGCAADLRHAVRLLRELAADRWMLDLDLDLADDAAVDAYVRAEHRAFLHGCGTCALGAVVDEHLRVQGTEGLRVCDTSVIPTVPRANPNLTILAVAHRAADLLA